MDQKSPKNQSNQDKTQSLYQKRFDQIMQDNELLDSHPALKLAGVFCFENKDTRTTIKIERMQQRIVHGNFEALLRSEGEYYLIYKISENVYIGNITTSTNYITFDCNSDYEKEFFILIPELRQILELCEMCTISLYGTLKS